MKSILTTLTAATVISFCSISCTNNTNNKVNIDSKFSKVTDGVEAQLTLTGLKPNSQHGLHIHEKGECSPPDFKSAGEHFNPDSQPHGAPGAPISHVGDLGNITADANGNFSGVVKVPNATFDGPRSILNRSLVVHEKTDDLSTQPAGDSGDRIACTVIKGS
jgi:superoxide dismutase, Cu-Zn family